MDAVAVAHGRVLHPADQARGSVELFELLCIGLDFLWRHVAIDKEMLGRSLLPRGTCRRS
jgi:hypothetical protein